METSHAHTLDLDRSLASIPCMQANSARSKAARQNGEAILYRLRIFSYTGYGTKIDSEFAFNSGTKVGSIIVPARLQ